ncbi:MAG TPA: mechanosensitive ion channel domain-containing protein [Chloroflexota bacterium]|nr:mechanosensitive ion channel domain-containing protein [Chloroflexota bacterium]
MGRCFGSMLDTTPAIQLLGDAATRVLLALVIAALTLLVATRTRGGIVDFFHRVHRDASLAILLGRAAYVLVLLLGLLLILPIFDLNITAFFAALGIIGLAVSLAIQDVLKNVFAGVYILLERPFRPGDVIKVRDFLGTVETIDVRTTTLRSKGERILVPNAILLSEILINRGDVPLLPPQNASTTGSEPTYASSPPPIQYGDSRTTPDEHPGSGQPRSEGSSRD